MASFSDLDLDDKAGRRHVEGGDPPTSGPGQDR